MDTLFCDSDTQIIENAHENKNIKIKGIIDTSNNPVNFEKWTDLFTKWLEKHKWCFGGITSESMINCERVEHNGFRKDTINICSRCQVCFDGMCDFIFGDKAFPGLSLQERICKNSIGQDMTVYKVVSCSQFEPMEESFKNGRDDIE